MLYVGLGYSIFTFLLYYTLQYSVSVIVGLFNWFNRTTAKSLILHILKPTAFTFKTKAGNQSTTCQLV